MHVSSFSAVAIIAFDFCSSEGKIGHRASVFVPSFRGREIGAAGGRTLGILKTFEITFKIPFFILE